MIDDYAAQVTGITHVGFNGGSQLAISGLDANAVAEDLLIQMTAAASGLLSAMVLAKFFHKMPFGGILTIQFT